MLFIVKLYQTLKLSFSRFVHKLIASNIWAKILNIIFCQKHFIYVEKNKEMTLLECADNFQTLRTIIKTTIKTDLKKNPTKPLDGRKQCLRIWVLE